MNDSKDSEEKKEANNINNIETTYAAQSVGEINIDKNGNMIINDKTKEELVKIDENKIENNHKALEDNIHAKKEEEKNNVEKNVVQVEYLKKIQEEEAHKKETLKQLIKYYDDLLNNIIINWESNKENFENIYTNINSQILNMLNISCIISIQDNVILIFRFLCNFINFFKDKLNLIPKIVISFFYQLNEYEIFSRNPKNINANNIFNSNNDLIEDKIFYIILKDFVPDIEIEHHEFPLINNSMYKYFMNYLFYSGFNKNFLTDFLTREDLDFNEYIHFSNYAFQMLINCSSDFIQKNDYNILLIKNFINKINFYLNDTENFLKENKAQYLQIIKFMNDKFNKQIYGALAYMLDILEKNKLEEESENFCFCIFKPYEILLKQQKLELRIFAIDNLSYIVDYLQPIDKIMKLYKNDYNDVDKVMEYVIKKFLKFVQKIDIFNLIFGENIHEAIIERSYKILSFMYKNEYFGTNQVSELWKLSISKYQTISNSIISLLGKLLPEFSNENCNTILQTVSCMNYNEINEITLKLLENFFKSNQRHENLLNILYKYSNELSYYEGLSYTIINKSRKILISLLFNQIYANDLHQCIKNCLFCLDNNYLLNTNINIFSEIIGKFIITEKAENTKAIYKSINENINDFGMLVSFLDEKYSMENILMNCLFFIKKLFVFLVQLSIKLKQLINEGNFDFDSLLDLDKLMLEYKNYEDMNDNDDNKMDIESEINESNNINMNDNGDENIKYQILPKNYKDIENYIKIILKDFIDYYKNKLIKEKITLTDDEIANNIFTQFQFSYDKNSFKKIVNKIINEIILSMHHIGNVYIKRELFDFLYQLLIENAIIKEEKEIYFNFIKTLLLFQTNNYYFNLISENDMEYIYIEKIVSNDISKLPMAAYEAFILYIKYINQKNGNTISSYTNNEEKFIDIKNIKLFVGLKTLINFNAIQENIHIYSESKQILNNILEITAKDKINRKYLLDELFLLLDFYKNKAKENKDNNNEKTAMRRIIGLISTINKTKVSKNLYDKNDPNNMINLFFKNNFYFTNDDQNIPFQAFKGLTIKELKDELIEKIICTSQYDLNLFNNLQNYVHPDMLNLDQLKNEIRSHNLIVLFCSPKILRDEYTLAEYNLKSGDEIVILNGASTNINNINNSNLNMTDAQLKEAYNKINLVFENKYNEDIMKEALIKNNGDVDNTIIFMAESDMTKLINELEIKKQNEPKKIEEIMYLEESKFNYLLDILNDGDQNINIVIWELLAEIKLPDEIVMNAIGEQFDSILNENNLNKRIFILKIINRVIFDEGNFCKHNKLDKKIKNAWISKFINNDKFISELLKYLANLNIDETNENNNSHIVYIIIIWFLNIFDKISQNEAFKEKIFNDDDSNSNFNIIEENKIEHRNKKMEICTNENNNANNNKKEEEDKSDKYTLEINDINTFLFILEKNNFVVTLYSILSEILNFKSFKAKLERRYTIDNIYKILIQYFDIKPNEVYAFLEEEKNKKIILNILISLKEDAVRKSTMNFIKNLLDKIKQKNNNANIKEEDKIDVQSYLLNIYFGEIISEEVHYEEFYEVYNYLINIETVKPQTIPIDKIIEKFVDYLYNYYINSKNNLEENNSDKEKIMKITNKLKYNLYILNCFYPFYSNLLQNEIEKKYTEKKDIINIIYTSLFELDQQKLQKNYPYLFSNSQLRINALNFLSILISLKPEYYNLILTKILSHHNNIPSKKKGLPVDNNLRDFEKQKYIGLNNYGATCYLNSLLQQMYMIPSFKEDLFKFNINESNEEKLSESTIYNMQKTFINLKRSNMQYYPPMDFIKSFKSAFNGEPISVSVQQDTDEFLAILCDKLEEEAKIFNKQDFLENSFKGGISNEILSLEKDYKYYSEITEPFYRITLDIKGHKTLEEALDAYVKGEILDGENKYFCSDYKKKISVKKRTSIKFMGNEIILHLKRFEFDFITFQNNKLNDYLKFPLNLNLKKWTRANIRLNELKNEMGENFNNNNEIISEREKENLENDKMDFELTGILVHSGSSLQSGHYYSIIKDQETNIWYKFNDKTITEFNIEKDLETECFGNVENYKNKYGKGAYLLFYTRKHSIRKYQNFESNIIYNEKILNNVIKENIDFIKIKTFRSDEYCKFILKFVQISIDYFTYHNKDIDIEINEINSYDKLMNKEMIREIKIYQKILELLKGNKENEIGINDEEIKVIPKNMNEIYEKCKSEIIFNEENKIKKEKKISIKDIIKLLFNYTFGIIYQYNDKESILSECIESLINIFEKQENHSYFALKIMKLMEKNISFFIDLLFKYSYDKTEIKGINNSIYKLYTTLFSSVEYYEKEKYNYITKETFYYYIKDDKGNCHFEKEYKSITLRMFKKLFCDNLEKCRKEYIRENLFLNLFDFLIISISETSIVASNYLIPLISFITNNGITQFKSEVNPNFKMGNKPMEYHPNQIYMNAFCNIILRCATPGMLNSKKKSPFFHSDINLSQENNNFINCPTLPNNWSKFLDQSFFYHVFLPCQSLDISRVICHICFYDYNVSCNIMQQLKIWLKNEYFYLTFIEENTLKICEIFTLDDNLNEARLNTLFDFDKPDNDETLLNFYYGIRYRAPRITLKGIKILTQLVVRYNVVYQYFEKNKNKLKWINDFHAETIVNIAEQNTYYKDIKTILDKNEDLMEFIHKEFINKLEL